MEVGVTFLEYECIFYLLYVTTVSVFILILLGYDSIISQVCPSFIRPYIEGYETIAYSLLHLCGLCNACINPVLYGYLNENVRKEYKNIYR